MPCTREFKHDEHLFPVPGDPVKRWCPGRKRKPLRTVVLFFRAMKKDW